MGDNGSSLAYSRMTAEMERIFSHINQVNLWQSNESVSGRGSELDCTAAIRVKLPELFEKYNITSILDAPCGDFNWMQHIPQAHKAYIGMDIVSEMIEKNQQHYGNDTIQFRVGDLTQNRLPKVDLILCRDCLVHLSLWDISCALKQFKLSGAQYLLTTTYPETSVNPDSPTGSWRSLNLNLPPFNFPAPLERLADPSDDTQMNSDKSLSLWRLADITPFTVSRWRSPKLVLTSIIRNYINPSWKL
jgi:SAM-dependent methyltransferase